MQALGDRRLKQESTNLGGRSHSLKVELTKWPASGQIWPSPKLGRPGPFAITDSQQTSLLALGGNEKLIRPNAILES